MAKITITAPVSFENHLPKVGEVLTVSDVEAKELIDLGVAVSGELPPKKTDK